MSRSNLLIIVNLSIMKVELAQTIFVRDGSPDLGMASRSRGTACLRVAIYENDILRERRIPSKMERGWKV